MKYPYSIFTALILTIILGFIFMKDDKKNEIFIFGTSGYPFSSDPLDYDYYIHHYAFSSVFSKLISSEKSGGFVPMIASEWKNSNNLKTWSFKIRKDLSFSNGDKISSTKCLSINTFNSSFTDF